MTATSKKSKAETPQAGPAIMSTYEKCPVYWCRFCNGNTCTLRRDDSMRSIVCIREDNDTLKFFDKTKKKTED